MTDDKIQVMDQLLLLETGPETRTMPLAAIAFSWALPGAARAPWPGRVWGRVFRGSIEGSFRFGHAGRSSFSLFGLHLLYHPRVCALPVPPADSEALKAPKHPSSKLPPPPKSSCLKNSSHQMGESPAPRCLIGREAVQADAGTSGPQHPQHSPSCLQRLPTRVGPLRLRGTSPVYLASAPREVGAWSSFSFTKSCFEAERDFCCPYLSLLDTVTDFMAWAEGFRAVLRTLWLGLWAKGFRAVLRTLLLRVLVFESCSAACRAVLWTCCLGRKMTL